MNPRDRLAQRWCLRVFKGQAVYWIGPILGIAAAVYDSLLLRRGKDSAADGAIEPK